MATLQHHLFLVRGADLNDQMHGGVVGYDVVVFSDPACKIGTLMLARLAARPPTDMVSLNNLLSHIRSLVIVRKYSPASGRMSLAQRQTFDTN